MFFASLAKFCFIGEIILRVIADGWTWTGPQPHRPGSVWTRAEASRFFAAGNASDVELASGVNVSCMCIAIPRLFGTLFCSTKVLIAVTGMLASSGIGKRTGAESSRDRNHPKLYLGTCL